MKILSINTSSGNGEICIKDDEKVTFTKIVSPYSENIITAIQNTLTHAKLELNDIDVFGVVTGPGSFTGIRIGMAVIKGFLCGLNKKCIEINSFELLSYNIKDSNFVAVLDSGNADCYYAIFKDKLTAEIGFGTTDKIREFAKKENLKVYYSSLETDKFENEKDFVKIEVVQNTLANLTFDRANENMAISVEKLSPIYIKLSQAEIGLEQKMKENLSFRVADKNDIEALAIIDEQCFLNGSERYSKNGFKEELNEPSKHYIVALYGNLVIGYIGLQSLGEELNLLKIAVLPQYRCLGVGHKLMQMSCDYKKDNNFTTFFLEVSENNQTAIKLYKKFGFVIKGKRENYYTDGSTALVMFQK